MDTLFEIWATLKKNKLRTLLTGFAVAWGIFMLIVLLGSGNGLINGMTSNYGDRANNVINIYGDYTSIAYQGYNKGREIKLTTDDLQYLKQCFPKRISAAVAAVRMWDQTVSNQGEYINTTVNGVFPEYTIIDGYKVLAGKGRNINHQDIRLERKVAVIHPKTAEILFGQKSPIGKSIKIGAVMFTVVGIYDANEASDRQDVQLPYTTMQTIYNKGAYVNNISLLMNGLKTEEDNQAFEAELRKAMAHKKQFHKDDQEAIWIWNKYEQYLQTQFIFGALRIAIWVIGLLTLISGIVGVSNIMLVSVKERTKEFGIRKAIGASPFAILKVVILESVLLTSIFGYIGMILGIGITEIVNYVMLQNAASTQSNMTIFLNPTVSLDISIGATLTLIIAGTLAGFFPAKKAVSIKPIEALNAK